MNDILTEQEVATLLDCEPATVQEKARNADLPGLKYGRSWVFPRAALMEALHTKALARRPAKPEPVATFVKQSQRKAPPVLPTLTRVGA
jgi:excisionase family DNA binding protein